jgi:hypothetical protein
MKQTTYSVVLLASLLLASPVSANELELRARASTTPGVRVELREEMRGKIQERRGEIETRKASSTERRIEMQQGVAKRQAEHAAKVMTATIERLDKIVARVESRIAKVKASGATTTESEGFLSDARVHLSEARTSLSAFTSIDLSADKAKINFEAIRTAGAKVKSDIKAAHESLMKAMRALKGPRGDERENATSTEQ